MQKYLILGSTSFAGSSLINYLLTKGERVIGVSRSEESHPVMLPYHQNKNKKAYSFYQYDINHHLDEIKKLINDHKPNYIVDFAGQGMVAESWLDPSQWYQTNIVSKVQLHQFLMTCDYLERYVRISTPEVYGQTENILDENQPLNPSTPYAVSHAAIDLSLMAYYKQHKFPVILTRFANFYGPCQQLYRIVPRTILYGLLGKKLPLHGGGSSQRMFIYADDISDGIYRAIHQGEVGQVYHFTNGPMISIHELVVKICSLMNINFESFVEVTNDRAGKDNKYEMDATKSHKSLHWQPTITLDQGLSNTADWIRQNLSILQNLPLNYVHKP